MFNLETVGVACSNHQKYASPSVEQHNKTALGVAARADEVAIVDMIIKAERYNAWKEVRFTLPFFSTCGAVCTCH